MLTATLISALLHFFNIITTQYFFITIVWYISVQQMTLATDITAYRYIKVKTGELTNTKLSCTKHMRNNSRKTYTFCVLVNIIHETKLLIWKLETNRYFKNTYCISNFYTSYNHYSLYIQHKVKYWKLTWSQFERRTM